MATTAQSTTDLLQIVPLHRFSTADYLEMVDKGVLGPKDKVELIGGVIAEMSPAGIPHNHFLIRILDLFGPLLGRFKLSIQGTLTVREGHVYDPDFMLLRLRPDDYKNALPSSEDVLLLIEAADSSLRRDQHIKMPEYAAAGIPEYWIADLDKEMLIVHRNPAGRTYASIETRRGDDVVSPSAAPELSFAARQMFK